MSHLVRALALAGLFALSPAFAATTSGVETSLEARKVERSTEGKERLVAATSAKPGDTIEYTATYRNAGALPVRNLEATLPIPANTEYVEGSASTAGAKASLDGQAFEAMPLKRRVVREGVASEEPVPLREYRYLRWYPGELAPGRSISFSARVKVVEDSAPRGASDRGSPR